MSVAALGHSLVLATVAFPQEADGGERLLARIPEGLEISTDLVRRNNRDAFSRRRSIEWDADGRTVAYAAQRGAEFFPVIGEAIGEAFGSVDRPLVRGGHAFFHVARVKSETEEQHWLWVDGRKTGAENWMGELVARADGKQVAFWTRPGAKFGSATTPGNAKYELVVATDKGAQWSRARSDEWSEAGTAQFSGDGKQLFAVACDRQGWAVFQAGKKETKLCEPWDGIESFALSADGSALALVRTAPARADGTAFLSLADKPELLFRGSRVGSEHALVASATVDARGAHVAYVVTRGAKRTVAIDEEREPCGEHAFVLELTFDPTGEELACVAVDGGAESKEIPGLIVGGQWFVVVRTCTAQAEPIEHTRFLEVRDLVWDSRGARLAYAARDESGWFIVCGDTRSPAHDDVGRPAFSADGRTIGFGSQDGSELWWRELLP